MKSEPLGSATTGEFFVPDVVTNRVIWIPLVVNCLFLTVLPTE